MAAPAQSNEELLIQATVLAIENDDIDNFQMLCSKMPIFRKTIDFKIDLLMIMFHPALLFNRLRMVREIIYQIDDNDIITEQSIIYELFGSRKVSNPYLTLLRTAFSDPRYEVITWSEIMDVFIQKGETSSTAFACRRITYIYGDQNLDTYQAFKEIADDAENYTVSNYLSSKIREVSPYIDDPPYVMNFMEPLQPTDEYIQNNLPQPVEVNDLPITLTDEEAINTVVTGIIGGVEEESEYTPEQVELRISTLREKWPRLSHVDKRVLLEPVLKRTADNINSDNNNLVLFRLMGPANPFNDRVYVDDDDNRNCSQYGCRMLYCNCLERYDVEDDIYVDVGMIPDFDWFLKPKEDIAACYQCDLKIKHRAQAVRLPGNTGGWIGKFCSEKCALEYQSNIEYSRFDPTGEDKYKRMLFKLYMAEITKIGLQTRFS